MNLSDSISTSLESNIKKGKIGEEIAKIDYTLNGFQIIPTGRGSDFIAKKTNNSTKSLEYVEVKTGKSRQTKRQKKDMRKLKKAGYKYTIYRVTDAFLDAYLNSKNARMEVS